MDYRIAISAVFTLVLSLWFAAPIASAPSKNYGDLKGSEPLQPHLEAARRLWNGAKKSYKAFQQGLTRKITKRSVVNVNRRSVSEHEVLTNLTATKYMLDLYRNLTNSTTSESKTTEANTIRSLLYNEKTITPSCGEFNFTISAINYTEYILKAELHLYLKHNSYPSNEPTHIVEINISESNLTIKSRIAAGTSERYIVFRVEELIEALVQAGKTYALFTVKIYKADDPKQEVGSCTEVKFVYQSVNEDNIPLLIVYSYDPKIEHMNYKLLAERVLAENMLSTTAATSDTLPGVQAVPDSERRKRDDATMAPTATSPPIPGCRVNELTINAQDLRYLNPNKNPKGFNVIMPVTYNAGICGGKCDRSLPSNSGSDHALFIHLLLGTEGFKQQQKSHYSYTQCCVPISYKPLEVLYEDDVNNLSINIIKDMIIKECECLDVLDF